MERPTAKDFFLLPRSETLRSAAAPLIEFTQLSIIISLRWSEADRAHTII